MQRRSRQLQSRPTLLRNLPPVPASPVQATSESAPTAVSQLLICLDLLRQACSCCKLDYNTAAIPVSGSTGRKANTNGFCMAVGDRRVIKGWLGHSRCNTDRDGANSTQSARW